MQSGTISTMYVLFRILNLPTLVEGNIFFNFGGLALGSLDIFDVRTPSLQSQIGSNNSNMVPHKKTPKWVILFPCGSLCTTGTTISYSTVGHDLQESRAHTACWSESFGVCRLLVFRGAHLGRGGEKGKQPRPASRPS